MAGRKRKPLTAAQRALKKARDARYRAAHRDDINRRARERRASRKQNFGPAYDERIDRAFRPVAGYWGSEQEFWDQIEDERENGVTIAGIVQRLQDQADESELYMRGDTPSGRSAWYGRPDDSPSDDRFFYYHAGFS